MKKKKNQQLQMHVLMQVDSTVEMMSQIGQVIHQVDVFHLTIYVMVGKIA